MMRYAELLTPEQVERVHEASLEILEAVGVWVRNGEARSLLGRHGCHVDGESGVVRFPRDVVGRFTDACPSRFTYHGRDPRHDRTLPDDGPLMVTASSAPDILDLETGQVRRARSDDIARIAYLVNELPGYDLLALPVTADDAPPG
ncbi:MAG: trimethylamine methyltransferase family protein, partial [Anaerolineae bacterium]